MATREYVAVIVFFVVALFYPGESIGHKNMTNNVTSAPQPPPPPTINTCCAINLQSETAVKCQPSNKQGGNNDILPSKSLAIPAHLMAENISFSFRIAPQRTKFCSPNSLTTFTMPLNISSSDQSELFLLRNGYLRIDDHYFHPDEFCVNGKNATSLEISVCPQSCKGPRPCIVKCCGLHQVYNFAFTPNSSPKRGCQTIQDYSNNYFSPVTYTDFEHAAHDATALAPHYVSRYPSEFKFQCHENKTNLFVFPSTAETIASHTPYNMTGHPFKVRHDGKILYRERDGVCAVIDPLASNMCIDAVINFGPEVKPFKNDEEDLVLFLCSLPPREGETEEGGFLYGSLMIGSSVFLLLTIAVYFMLWERQTVHGWTILSHTISLFLMYIFLGTSHLLRVTQGYAILRMEFCFAIAVLSHFFFLSTFCWLCMISIDLWLTFRAMTPRRGANSKGFKRYSFYSVMGWGVPAIIVGTGWTLTKDHPERSCGTILTPGYGVTSCFLQEKALGAYLYYPIAAMIIINLIFFTVTSVKLYVYQNSTKIATKDDTQQQFYRLFFKLFFVMGVFYIFELISWFVSGSGVFWYWAAFDILNILRAVAVFIIFVCKPDILWALEQNYPWLKPILIPCACITRKKRTFSQRRAAESESLGLNTSLSTKQSTLRSSNHVRNINRIMD